MQDKTVVITGANTGIGLEAARELARQGARVVMTARNADKGRAAVEDVRTSTGNTRVELVVFDLASLASVREGARAIQEKVSRIDVLVNNAGLVLSERQLTRDGLEATIGINNLGPFLLTHELLPLLEAARPARVVNVASRAHKRVSGIWFDDLMAERWPYIGFRVYSHSKLANVLFTRELGRRLEGKGVTTYAVHPGVVATGFGADGDVSGLFGLGIRIARRFMIDAVEGAKTTLHCATAPQLEGVTGRYYAESAELDASRAGRDDAAARRLWDVSAELVGAR